MGGNRMGDSDRTMDRTQFGSRVGSGPPQRSQGGFGGHQGGYGGRSRGAYGGAPTRRGDFDGSGSGFAAHIVADLRDGNMSSKDTGMNPRMNYFEGPKRTGASRFQRDADPLPGQQPSSGRNLNSPWGATSAKPRKSNEEIKEEEEAKAQREREANKERNQRDAKIAEEKASKMAVKKARAEEKKRAKEEKERLVALRTYVDTMLEENAPSDLTMEHLEVVLPQLDNENNLSVEAAQTLGTSLAMTVNKDVVSIINIIDYIPNSNYDETLLSLLSALCTRMGDVAFVNEMQAQGVELEELLRNKVDIDNRLLEAGLKCLLTDNETESQLEESFNKHIGLKELHDVIVGIEDLPIDLLLRVCSYIFDEYFTNQDTEAPASYFQSSAIFELVAGRLGSQVDIVDSAIKSWFANGKDPSKLLPMFDCLLRNACIYPEAMVEWQQDVEPHDAKSEAMFCEVDEMEQTFNDWIMTCEENEDYQFSEDEYDDDEDELNYL